MSLYPAELLTELQRADLMGTGCQENGMDDEYAAEADQVARLVSCGSPLRDAIVTTFEHQFWIGCLDEPDRAEGFQKLLHRFA